MFKTKKRVNTKEYLYLLQLKMQLIENRNQQILLPPNTNFIIQGINYEDQVKRKNNISFSVNNKKNRQQRLSLSDQKVRNGNQINFKDQIYANRITFSLKTENNTNQQMKLTQINRITKTQDKLNIQYKLPKLSTPQPQLSSWPYSDSFSDLEI